jgi:hypothetical protein
VVFFGVKEGRVQVGVGVGRGEVVYFWVEGGVLMLGLGEGVGEGHFGGGLLGAEEGAMGSI